MAKFSAGHPLDLRRKGAPRKEQRELSFGSHRPRRKPLRSRRMRARLWSVVFAFFVFALIVVVIFWASYLPRFNVQSFVVEGATNTNAKDVEDFAFAEIHTKGRPLLSPSNIFLYDPPRLEQAILTHFPPLKSVHASRPT